MDLLSAILLALFVVGYLVLAGADIGLGMLMPKVARTPQQRRRVVAAIAPYFLASEVWLVAAVGVLAGMFPVLEHHVVSKLWPVLVLLLAGWLLRDAGLWLRARVDSPRWRNACDTAIVTGSWTVAVTWGLTVAGLLTGGLTPSLFTPLCVLAVVSLFALRGAAFGAERLVAAPDGTGRSADRTSNPDSTGGTGNAGGADDGESADVAGGATRLLARVALGATVTAAAAALLPGGPVLDRPLVTVVLVALAVASLTVTTGIMGPLLSRHTSAVAIAVPGLLLALAVELPSSSIPAATGALVWTTLIPAIPVMFIGQVWLYRMTRRPAPAPTFFA